MIRILNSKRISGIPPLEISDEELSEISVILSMQSGFSISMYKENCLKRRIAIRMRSCRAWDVAAYCALLRRDGEERADLIRTLTIHVSHFFRNPQVFETLRREVLPKIFDTAGAPLTIWSAGCAGGEEPYSLAILLKEGFPDETEKHQLKIIASDIDADSVAKAIKGNYPEDRLKEMGKRMIDRHFSTDGARYQLNQNIRDMVRFEVSDMVRAEIPGCSMVMCRNTLIYFGREQQEKLLCRIADKLPSGAFLVLGKSESLIGRSRQFFEPVHQMERIYRKY